MDIYNKLKINYEKGGLDTLVQRKDGWYCIFSGIRSDKGINSSNFHETIEGCKDWVGDNHISESSTRRWSKTNNWKIVKTIARESHYDVGDKVKIRRNGNIKEIIDTDDFFNYELCIGSDWHNSTEIEPYFEEEKTEELTLKQVCKELGRDIKIIK